MENLQIQLVLPNDLVSEVLANKEAGIKKLREKVILELVRYQKITTMHAASLLNMEWENFVRFMGENEIPYFNMSDEEWKEECKAHDAALEKSRHQKLEEINMGMFHFSLKLL